MENNRIESAIEAVLFSVGDAVPAKKLAEALELNVKTLKQIIGQMKSKYEAQDRGIQLVELEGAYQLCSKSDHYDLIKKIAVKVKEVNLTDVLIETLAIIAYKQPITKAHIEDIRGVNSNHAVNKLVELGLVDDVGRLQAPGRPVLFGTSKNFLRAFGLKSVDDMPFLDEDKLSEIKKTVFEETNIHQEEYEELEKAAEEAERLAELEAEKAEEEDSSEQSEVITSGEMLSSDTEVEEVIEIEETTSENSTQDE